MAQKVRRGNHSLLLAMTSQNVLVAANRAMAGWNRIACCAVKGGHAGSTATMSRGIIVMKTVTTLLAVAAFAVAAGSAEAKGCLKGAAVGGVAGHYAGHHGLLGAAAGCLYGRHRARQQEQSQLPKTDNGQM
jgi:hypothetical protein